MRVHGELILMALRAVLPVLCWHWSTGRESYRLNYIRAKRADTSLAWISSIFLVMNLLVLLRVFFALCKRGIAGILLSLLSARKTLCRHRKASLIIDGSFCQTVTC